MPHDIQLTTELQQRIIASIRSGVDARDAAQAWEVPADVFDEWLAQGEREDADEIYRTFAREIRTAQAQARAKAEMEVFQGYPKIWLDYGPGATAGEGEFNALLQRAFIDAANVLLDALLPYPEARACAARALAQLSIQPSKGHAHVEETAKDASPVQPGSRSAVA